MPSAIAITNSDVDLRRAARALYWMQWRVTDIAEHIGVPRTTIESWKGRGKWDSYPAIVRIESCLEARMVALVNKDPKNGSDYKEIDLLGRQIERLARVRRYEQPGGHEGDLNPNIEARNAGPKRRPARNAISDAQQAKLIEVFENSLFGYQRVWRKAGLSERIRNILKSRQIGATWYFAREALVDALETGRNEIFISASKAQAHVFKQYIQQFAAEADVELTGDPIVLPNQATLYFLGTNSRTAQSYHGNLLFDEYFWVYQFQQLRKVASGMAIHKKWRQTYFSTPSAITHDAYPFWAGQLYNRGRPKGERVDIDVSHEALKNGMRCADGQWRQIVTVEDAMAGGCDLFDLDQLRLEYSADEWMNLLMCMFIDDTDAVFGLSMLQRCCVDSWVEWEDYKPFALRPLGDRPAWIGYDPNGESVKGDTAGCVVLAPPAVPGGKFRVIERHRWPGQDFAAQAEAIRKITLRYNVQHIGIDTTGLGSAVAQLVRDFFPGVRSIRYTPESKSMLVLKALDVISSGRMEFDAGWRDLAQAFMSIRRTTTESGRLVTYRAGRSEETSHADIAWATMHALAFEPLAGANSRNTGIMEISG